MLHRQPFEPLMGTLKAAVEVCKGAQETQGG